MTVTIAVTGGIGAGKSTVSARLSELGAVVIDSDKLAREVVAPGTPGLRAVVEEFGDRVIAADGSLDRAALAGIVFADTGARRRLEAITHPLVRQEFAARRAAAGPDAVVVNDIPILVDQQVAAGFELVIGVHAHLEARVSRLIERGLSESDARSRIAAQIDDEARRRLCDAWLSNNHGAAELQAAIDSCWADRILVLREAIRRDRAAAGNLWAGLFDGVVERTVLRVERATGAVPEVVGQDDRDGIDLLVTGPSVPDWAGRLSSAGFPVRPGEADLRGAADPALKVRLRVVV